MVPRTLLSHGVSNAHLHYATVNLHIGYSRKTEYGKRLVRWSPPFTGWLGTNTSKEQTWINPSFFQIMSWEFFKTSDSQGKAQVYCALQSNNLGSSGGYLFIDEQL